MQKYFFDLVGQHYCEYDYHGRALAAPEQALQHAELLVLDLEMDADRQWSGWAVPCATLGAINSARFRCAILIWWQLDSRSLRPASRDNDT
jgi:hypothetical protein